MTSHPISKLHAILVEDAVDSHERIAQELIDEGLSGVADDDTWRLNSRLELHDRSAHRFFDLAS